MNQSVDLPLGGVDAVCPGLLCQIAVARPGGWCLVGACNGIELAAKHIKTLEKFCPNLFFQPFITGLSMDAIKTLVINSPRFEQGEDVWALFQGHAHPLRVVKRLYNPDTSAWYYKLSQTSLIFIEDDLSPRSSEFDTSSLSDTSTETTDHPIGH